MNWIAVGAGIAVGAAVIAWLCDSATEEEESRQEGLREQIDALESELKNFDVDLADQTAGAQRKAILDVLKKLEEGCSDFEKSKSFIYQELESLAQYINRELKNDEVGPFRRQALLWNRSRVEDAQARLNAYLVYLEYYRSDILNHWKARADSIDSTDGLADLLNEFQPPSPTLPEDYLYIGKVVLLQDCELDVPLPYNSMVHLNGKRGSPANISQRKIFESYKDEEGYSAIQVLSETTGKYGNRIFYGCAARGNAWLTIDDGVEFQVSRRSINDKPYSIEAFEGLLKAILPVNKVDNPFINLVESQRIRAWFDEYDLLLGWSLKGKKNPIPKVTMIPGDTSSFSPEPVYLLMNADLSKSFGSQLRVGGASDWMLVDSSISTEDKKYQGRLVLLNGNIKVECIIDHEKGCLLARSIENSLPCGNESTLDLSVIPLADDLWSDELKGQDGITTICSHALQVKVNQREGEARAESAQRFERWRQVVDYQKSRNRFTLEFSSDDLEKGGGGEYILPDIKSVTASGFSTSSEWISKHDDARAVLPGKWSPYCVLEMFYNDEKLPNGQWRKIASTTGRGKLGLTVTIDAGRIFIEEISELFLSEEAATFRLTLEVPDASLKRQEQALDAYKNDRMVSPMLKEILSSPGTYLPVEDLSWVEYFGKGAEWQNKQLTCTQQQVIKSSLTDKHISIIQGPPGTAKTTSIVEMLCQIYSQNPESRVLLVSQQHAAVDNALKRFIEVRKDAYLEMPDILRIGPETKMDDAVKPFSLETILSEFKERSKKNSVDMLSHEDPSLRSLALQWKGVMSVDDKLDSELVSLLLNSRKLVGATCVGLAGTINNTDKLTFDIVIVDEAGRSTVPELLIPINRARKLILIGDHFQLPPSVAPMLREDDAREVLPFIEEEFLETSFFEILYSKLPEQCKTRLQEQFRMPPAIGDLVANLFYTYEGERRLFNGIDKSDNQFLFKDDKIVQWFDVKGKQERDEKSKSLLNVLEAAHILKFLETADQILDRSGGNKSVAVITPYGAQKRLINTQLKKSGCFDSCETDQREFSGRHLRVRVDTVDSFQGSEAELVLYSVVRTQGNLRFILDWKRLNVACSRAKENLVFFGAKDFLGNWESDSGDRNLFREVLSHIEAGKVNGKKQNESLSL